MSDRVARMTVLLSAMGIQRWQSRSNWVAHVESVVATMPDAHAKTVGRTFPATGEGAAPGEPTRVPPSPWADANQPRVEAHAAAEPAFSPVALSMWRTVRSLIFAPKALSFPSRFLNDLKHAVDGMDRTAPLFELPAFAWPPEGSRGLARTASMVSALRALIHREDKKQSLRFVLLFGDFGESALKELVSSLANSSNSDGTPQVNDSNGHAIQYVVLPSITRFLADSDSKRALWLTLRGPQ